ncbi:MAG: D-arabinono-1,4-lactone oxidase [Actinomycetota bacterium]
MTVVLRNWAGNHTYRATAIHRPRSVSELAEILTRGDVRVVGTRHTFSDIGDAGRLVSLDHLGERCEISADRRTVLVDGAMTYGRLSELLEPTGLALANLASLPHISIAGAIATATHGSGLRNGNLATAVRGLTLVSPSGVHSFRDLDDSFRGAVVSLGALGVVTDLTLAVEPTYDIAQTVYRGLTWERLLDGLEAILGSAYSVSVFTRFGAVPDAVWIKRRIGRDTVGDEVAGLVAETEMCHPIDGHPAEACTSQLGVPGRWADRLPHFRADARPSSGAEIQSEYFVPLHHGADAIEAVRAVAHRIAEVLLVSEIRTVAGDGLWLSPQSDGPTLALHFTWVDDPVRARDAVRAVEQALTPFAPRPHWGKFFTPAIAVGARYPALERFLDLQVRLDPAGVFRNPWFDRALSA